jgi:DNA-binding IclR family transcriptional regulator
MNTQSREPRAGDGGRLERAVVLQLLRDDHGQDWSRAELARELGAEASAIEEVLSRLHAEGVVRLDDDRISASPATRRLDGLELIAI